MSMCAVCFSLATVYEHKQRHVQSAQPQTLVCSGPALLQVQLGVLWLCNDFRSSKFGLSAGIICEVHESVKY